MILSIVSSCFFLFLTYFFFISHPMFLSMLVLLSSAMIYLFLSKTISSWAGMALMLIFLGGMMIIFLYLTSLTSSEKFFFKKNFLFLSGGGILLIYPLNLNKLSNLNFSLENLKEFYIFDKFLILFFVVSYLLMALILMVKISENFKGSLMKQF